MGKTGTLFFSLVNTADYALGRSVVNTTVTISGRNHIFHQWHPQHPDMQSTTAVLPRQNTPFLQAS